MNCREIVPHDEVAQLPLVRIDEFLTLADLVELAEDVVAFLLRYTFDAQAERTGIPSLLRKLGELGIAFKDLDTSKSSLEDIFVDLEAAKRK